MKKKILLVGNTDGLPGVKVDLANYKNYFKSRRGGQWNDSEIIERINPKREEVVNQIDSLKNQNLDYALVIFSGHGGMKRDTFLELNTSGELIMESRFDGISKRQVTILDCCRAFSPNLADSINEVRMFKAEGLAGTRERFEKRILDSAEQQIKMYSCAAGECSHDTPKGGVYSKNLLESAIADDSEFIYFGRTHVTASEKTTEAFKDQHPEIIQPKLLTLQQIIFGIN